MEFQDILKRAVKIKQAYALLNRTEGGKKWTASEYMQGLVGDVGDLAKLIMARRGYRFDLKADLEDKLAHELADCLWSIIVIAEELDIDLEKEFLKTMKKLENKLSERPLANRKRPRMIL